MTKGRRRRDHPTRHSQGGGLRSGVAWPTGAPARRISTLRFSTAFIRLSEADRPKIHGIWSELFVVQQDLGVVQTGGTITGETSSDYAAHRGFFVDVAPAAPQSEAEAKADTDRSREDAGSLSALIWRHPGPFLTVLAYTAGGSLIFYTFTTYMQKYLTAARAWTWPGTSSAKAGSGRTRRLIAPGFPRPRT